MSPSDDELKRAILARRARFVAAALSTTSLAAPACGGRAADSTRDTADPHGGGQNAGGDDGTGGEADGAGAGGTETPPSTCLGAPYPGPCLSIAEPDVCLSPDYDDDYYEPEPYACLEPPIYDDDIADDDIADDDGPAPSSFDAGLDGGSDVADGGVAQDGGGSEPPGSEDAGDPVEDK